MKDSKISLLIDRVIDKTEQGKIEWKKGVAQNSFVYNMEETSIIVYTTGEGFERFFIFGVLDETGAAIETIREKIIFLPDKDASPVNYLFQIARRKALKVDETVNNILTHIDVL